MARAKERVVSALEQARIDEQHALAITPVAELTAYDIDRMKSDVYILRLKSDPEFGKKVNELEAARTPRPKLG